MTSPPAPEPDVAPLLVVPAYFHPAARPAHWQWLAAHAASVRLVILNVASGPGSGPQEPFLDAIGPLGRAGISVIGYVDTGYGRRDPRTVLAETGCYRDWYGVQGVCLDQVSADAEHLRYYAELADQIRAMGAEVVFFNHGVHPVPEYAGHADLIGTFEGTWRAYRQLRTPPWTQLLPPSKFYHVVHSVPVDDIPAAWHLAARRRAGSVYITERGGANPYDSLPARTGNGAEVEPT